MRWMEAGLTTRRMLKKRFRMSRYKLKTPVHVSFVAFDARLPPFAACLAIRLEESSS
jgi:hypothetical protein